MNYQQFSMAVKVRHLPNISKTDLKFLKGKHYTESLLLSKKITSGNFFVIMKFIIDASNQILLKSLNQTELNALNT